MESRLLAGRPSRGIQSSWRKHGTTTPKTGYLFKASKQRLTRCYSLLIIYGLFVAILSLVTLYPNVVVVTRYSYEMRNSRRNTMGILVGVNTTSKSPLHATTTLRAVADNATIVKINTTPIVSSPKVINPHPFRFIIANEDACSGENTDVFLAVLVKCRVGETFDREQIRRTWGGVQVVLGRKIRTMFLTGKTNEHPKDKLLKAEDEKYHDIIQEDFMDSYFNLTYKTLMGWRWMSTFCPAASYAVSIDADMILNPRNLILRLETSPRKLFSEGNWRENVPPIRGRSSKWFIPKSLYPKKMFPPFLNGGCYVMSTDVAMRLYETSFRVPFFKLDDVYMGMVMAAMDFSANFSGLYQQYTSVEIGLKRGIAVGASHAKSINKQYLALWETIVGSELKKDKDHKRNEKEEDSGKKENEKIETEKETQETKD